MKLLLVATVACLLAMGYCEEKKISMLSDEFIELVKNKTKTWQVRRTGTQVGGGHGRSRDSQKGGHYLINCTSINLKS